MKKPSNENVRVQMPSAKFPDETNKETKKCLDSQSAIFRNRSNARQTMENCALTRMQQQNLCDTKKITQKRNTRKCIENTDA